MSSLDEDNFGWTTASSDNEAMYTEKDVQKKAIKRKVKEESVNDSSVEILENRRIKIEEPHSSSPYISIKKKTDSNMTNLKAIIKKNKKPKLLSSTVVSNDEVISDVSESHIFKKKSKKNKTYHTWDDTELNEISKIDNENATGNLDLSEISNNVDTKIQDSLEMRIDKKHKKRLKSKNLINGCLKMEHQNSIHIEHSQESYENLEDVEEPEIKKSKKKYKEKHKYKNVENMSLNIEETSFENVEVSPKKKKKKNSDHETPTFSQDNNRINDKKIKSSIIKKGFVNTSSDNDTKSNGDSTDTEKKSSEIRESLSLKKKKRIIKTNISHIRKNRSLSTSSSDSHIVSDIGHENHVKPEEPMNLETDHNISVSKNTQQSYKSGHLATTISDMVTFKNETIDYDQKVHAPKPDNSKLLLHYILKNKHLKPMTSKFADNSFLTEDDDMWIMKCPAEINIKAMRDSCLIIDNKCKIKIDNQRYQGILNDSKINVAMPFIEGNKFLMKNCVPQGIIRLRKRIPKPHFVQESNVDNSPHFIPLPETKVRHPLFGFDYKSYIKLPSYVTEKLQTLESNSNDNCVINKKKKKKKIKVEMEEQSVRPNKKRKICDNSDTDVVKTKKKKHKIRSEEMWESEKAIEESLFNL